MKIIKKELTEEKTTILNVEGRLDTITSTEFSKELETALEEDNTKVIVDLEKVIYVSSSGLRVLLTGVKKSNGNGKAFILKNVQDTVREVLEVTGFTDILTIEQ